MLFAAPTLTPAQPLPKIPAEVIDQAAADGRVLVLVGLKMPWQMESNLTEDQIQAQRDAIASIQKNLLSELAGKSYKITRRYDRIPGIALEVGADALAELAHSANVANVLLDRPAGRRRRDTVIGQSSFTIVQERRDERHGIGARRLAHALATRRSTERRSYHAAKKGYLKRAKLHFSGTGRDPI